MLYSACLKYAVTLYVTAFWTSDRSQFWYAYHCSQNLAHLKTRIIIGYMPKKVAVKQWVSAYFKLDLVL